MKKIVTSVFAISMIFALSLFFNSSAKEMTEDQFTVVIDNIVYELEREYERIKTEDGRWEWVKTNKGKNYIVTDFFYDKTEAAKATELNILSEVNGLPVTQIWIDSDAQEEYKKNIKKVTIPDTVETIGPYDFSDFTALKEIRLPEKLTYLHNGVFAGCTSLKKVIFNSKLETISTKAFKNCKSLKTVDLPENLRTIGSYAFLRSGLTEIDIPKKCIIRHRAFKECKSLKKVTINYSGKNKDYYTIPKSVFYNCSSLEGVYFTALETQIRTGAYAFSGCKKLKDIYFWGGRELWEETLMSGRRSEYYEDFNINFYNEHSHSFEKVKSSKNTLKFTCDCGDEFVFTAKNTGKHNYTKWNTVKKADCAVGTKHSFTCGDCGKKASFKLKESNRHSFGNWKTVKKATVEAEGKMKRTCTDCKKAETKAIRKLKDISELEVYIDDYQREKLMYNDGKTVKIKITYVGIEGEKFLTKNLHYKIIYKNAKNVTNKASVIIKGIEKNGYTGQKEITYTIKPRQPLEQKVDIVNDRIEMSWNKLPEADGYKVTLGFNKTGETVREDYYTTDTSYVIEGIEPKEEYYVEIESYTIVDGEKLFSRRNMYWILNEKDN